MFERDLRGCRRFGIAHDEDAADKIVDAFQEQPSVAIEGRKALAVGNGPVAAASG